MKRYIARHLLIAKLAALALSALYFLQAPVRAQGMTEVIVIFPSVGLAPGQSFCLTLSNPNDTPVRAQARLHHSGGIIVGLGDGSVRAGASHTFGIKRRDIPFPGEEGTGRIQLLGSVRLTFSEAIKPVVMSMETISISDGATNTIFVSEAPLTAPIGGKGNDVYIWDPGTLTDIYMGVAQSKRMRATLSNPPSFGPEAGSEAQRKPASGHVKVFDGSGNLIAQSDELVIPSGEIRSFDFNPDAPSFQIGTGTGQGRYHFCLTWNQTGSDYRPYLASFEIVDNSTGKTEVLAGQQCLVFYLGGTPGN